MRLLLASSLDGREPSPLGDDSQAVTDQIGHVAKVTGKGDRKTYDLACLFQLVFTVCSLVLCFQLCQIILDFLMFGSSRATKEAHNRFALRDARRVS